MARSRSVRQRLSTYQSAVNDVVFPSQSSLTKAVTIRVAIAGGALVAAALVVYLGRYGYSRVNGEPLTFLDAFYFATVSLSTTGYGDIVPVSPMAKLVNAVVLMPLRIMFLVVLVGSTIEVLTKRTQAEFREQRWRKRVQNHTIIVGFGVKGRSAAQALFDNGTEPKDIVVISSDPLEVQDATALGCIGIVGDARRGDVLQRAMIQRATRVVVATDQDDTTIFVTLSARNLAPNATVVAAAREARNVEVLRQSGADAVITTAEAAGRLMGISLVSPTAGTVMEDLLDPGEGLEVIERKINPGEPGRLVGDLADIGEIVLAVRRQGKLWRFDQLKSKILEEGDVLVVIRHVRKGPSRRR